MADLHEEKLTPQLAMPGGMGEEEEEEEEENNSTDSGGDGTETTSPSESP